MITKGDNLDTVLPLDNREAGMKPNELAARPPASRRGPGVFSIRVRDDVPFVDFAEAVAKIGCRICQDGRGGLIVERDI